VKSGGIWKTAPPDNGDGNAGEIEETVSPLTPSLGLYFSAEIAPWGPLFS
jgi:hypothetical protein